MACGSPAQDRGELTRKKVYLALKVSSLTAEKNNLENDFREATTMLKATEVSPSHTPA